MPGSGRRVGKLVEYFEDKPLLGQKVYDKKYFQFEVNDLKYSVSGKVAKYLANERKNNTCVVRKKSVQRLGCLDNLTLAGVGLLDSSNAVDNFVTKCFVVIAH
jgi:hypothetical protein